MEISNNKLNTLKKFHGKWIRPGLVKEENGI